MIAYASRTGTRRNLAALRAHGWRLLVSARGVHRTEGFPYAVDNGAWTAHQRQEPFDVSAFETVVDLLGADADWIVAPDIVAGGLPSLRLSMSWLPRLAPLGLVLVPVQDGMTAADVAPILGPGVGVFLGGSTGWKLATMRSWGSVARGRGAYYHVGRVNTARRIAMCAEAGAGSFDGSSASRFAVNVPRLTRAAGQRSFVWTGDATE